MSNITMLSVDSTFLSSILYEGYLRYLKHKSLLNSFEEVSSRILELKATSKSYRLNLATNDFMRPKSPIQLILKERITDLFDDEAIKKIRDLCEIVKITESTLSVSMKGSGMYIGKNPIYTAIQIFKLDRYTGFTSLEGRYTLGQYRLMLSIDTYLLGFIGLYSSYITRIRLNGDDEYYFLTFSPDEIANLLYQEQGLTEAYFIIKDYVIQQLRNILQKIRMDEAWILDLYLNTSIYSKMFENVISKISLTLFNIRLERRQTYKIYQILPITIYGEPPFMNILVKYLPEYSKRSEFLSKLRSSLGKIINKLPNTDLAEWSNLINAVRGLYNFVMLGNPSGLYIFARELANAYEKSGNESYQEILSQLSWCF